MQKSCIVQPQSILSVLTAGCAFRRISLPENGLPLSVEAVQIYPTEEGYSPLRMQGRRVRNADLTVRTIEISGMGTELSTCAEGCETARSIVSDNG